MTHGDGTEMRDGKDPLQQAQLVALAHRSGGIALRPGERDMLDRWLESCDEGEGQEALRRIIGLFG